MRKYHSRHTTSLLALCCWKLLLDNFGLNRFLKTWGVFARTFHMTVHLEGGATSTKVGRQAVGTALAWDFVLVPEIHSSLCLNHNQINQDDQVDAIKPGRKGNVSITAKIRIVNALDDVGEVKDEPNSCNNCIRVFGPRHGTVGTPSQLQLFH